MKVGSAANSTPSQGGDRMSDAISIFNEIKNVYSTKIEDLTEIKKDVVVSDSLDQPTKSKLRITLESLLIDLNEEIFSISEQLARSYGVEGH